MESSANNMSSGLAFGGLGSAKPLSSEPAKNVFGSPFGSKPSVFGSTAATATTSGTTGGGILKTPTFTSPTSGTSQSGLFGSAATSTTAGGLFGQSAAPAATGGGLFSSFKSPDAKPATSSFFGGSSTFGAAPAFGAAPVFGGGASLTTGFGAPATGLFGASAQPATSGFGSPASGSLFGSTNSSV